MNKNYFIDYLEKGYRIKELKSQYGIPLHLFCDICRNDGLCRNNEFSPYYDKRLFGEIDYLDCLIYYKTIRVRRDIIS